MLTAFTIAHVVISLILIVMVLLQDSKGDASGLVGGGGSKSVFGATGAASFVVKATRVVACLFGACCITLAYLTSHQTSNSGVFDRIQTPPALNQPAEDTTTPAPAIEEGTGTEAPADAPKNPNQ